MKQSFLLTVFTTVLLLTACTQVQEPSESQVGGMEADPSEEDTGASANQEDWSSIVAYNCDLSGGEFVNNTCMCPYEEELGQDSKTKYDLSTGFCSSDMGGPAGDAFNASVGLPYGAYDFWTDVVGNACVESGGDWLNASCACSDGKVYDESTGVCQ